MTLKKGIKEMVAEASARITAVSAEDAAKLLENHQHMFIDIRDVRELEREGMIPGAFHAPRGMLEFWVDPDSPYHKDVFSSGKTFILYCNSAWRSALATATLQDMGLENVCHLEGGFSGWKQADMPVVPRPKRGAKGE